MSDHIDAKHKVKEICRVKDFEDLLDMAMLNDEEKIIMRMIYIKSNDINFIADSLGLAPITVYKKHAKILKKIRKLL